MLRQQSTTLSIDTRGRGLLSITRVVTDWVAGSGMRSGLLTLFVQHTSASLLIQENADPDVRGDLDRFFARLVPDGDALFRHRNEGPDDMAAHVRATLTAVQLSIPLVDARLVLGTWQGIYLWEHRHRGQRRTIPARYCTGYITDLGIYPVPTAPMDFAGWFEAYLGDRWYTFDPRNNAPRLGRILMARGRDACDVALANTFGPNYLESFKVWADEHVQQTVA